MVIAALVVTGAFGWVDALIASFVESSYLHGLLLIGALSILAAVVDLPFGLYRIFSSFYKYFFFALFGILKHLCSSGPTT